MPAQRLSRARQALVCLFMTFVLPCASVPGAAHDWQEGTVGWHDRPLVTCYSTGTGTGRLALQPSAAGLAGGPLGVRFIIYTWKNRQWVHTHTTSFFTYREPVTSYAPVTVKTTPGYFSVTAEYAWHDGRAWSGHDRTGATSFTQITDHRRNPVAQAPPGPQVSRTCWAD